MKRTLTLLAAVALVALLAFAAACGDDDEEETPTPSDGGEATTVNVGLQEYAVNPTPHSAPAGDVTFVATNDGAEPHELVVVKSDLDPSELPTAADGSADEAQLDVIDEIEEFEAGGTEQATFTLDAGAYVLLCNVVDEEGEAHYTLGMHTPFTVE